jgi:enamine deaminase RidA (YjgF/YER057c/UK114 family)
MTAISAHGDYALAQRSGALIYSAGFTPRTDGRLVHVGTLGLDADETSARAAAELATSRSLKAMEAELPAGSLLRVLHLRVFIRCTPDVTELSSVADAASATIRDHLGQESPPARTAVGVASLPGGALVEVDLVAEITD